LNLTTANTRSPRQVVQCSAAKVLSHTQSVEVCLPETTPNLWCIHGRTEEMEKYIFQCVRTSGRRSFWHRSFLWMSLSSESSISSTTPKYLLWETDFTLRTPYVSNGMTALFAVSALNVIQTVLLQLKILFMRFCISLTHILIYFATHVHLVKAHKYHQRTSSHSIRFYPYKIQI